MPRPQEIAADARALYGPLALRPSAQEAGDGALWVDPSAQQPLTQVQSGNWVSLAPAGVPVLRGPYVVDYTDIPHDGDTVTLWTPQVGDVLLRLFADWQGATQWDYGSLFVGPNTTTTTNVFTSMNAGNIGGTAFPFDALDMQVDAVNSGLSDAAGHAISTSAYVFHNTNPVLAVLYNPSPNPDPTAGHVTLYALVARAVAP